MTARWSAPSWTRVLVLPAGRVRPVPGAGHRAARRQHPPAAGALAGHFGVVLLYRGSWCPYCNAQLRAFQRAHDGLASVDAKVVALSVDDEATTKALIARHGLQFPVGHSADARAVAAATGAFVNDDPLYLQSTGLCSTWAGG